MFTNFIDTVRNIQLEIYPKIKDAATETLSVKAYVDVAKANIEANKTSIEASKVLVLSKATDVESARLEVLSNKNLVDAAKASVDGSKTHIDTVKADVDSSKTTIDADKTIVTNAKDETVTAKDESLSAKASAEAARDKAIEAQSKSEQARDISVTSKDASIAAKDTATTLKAETLVLTEEARTIKTDVALSKDEALKERYKAEAEKKTAHSYANQPKNETVKEYTSNGDGTFTETGTTNYSSYHWSEISSVNIGGGNFVTTNGSQTITGATKFKIEKDVNTYISIDIDGDGKCGLFVNSGISIGDFRFNQLTRNWEANGSPIVLAHQLTTAIGDTTNLIDNNTNDIAANTVLINTNKNDIATASASATAAIAAIPEQVNPDWNESDATKKSFIKNKPGTNTFRTIVESDSFVDPAGRNIGDEFHNTLTNKLYMCLTISGTKTWKEI